MKPFRARGDELVARLDGAEAGVLGLLLDQLEQLLDADDVSEDPVLQRLFPEGHRGNAELAADYRDLTEESLRSAKAEDLATVRATLPPSGGDVRLALGVRLDITEDTEPPDDPVGEEGQQLAVYYWLTAVQGSLVDALVDGRAGRR
jgi:hypothetical protein